MLSFILAVVCGVLVLIADQVTKFFVSNNFQIGERTEFLKGFIDLIYINNKGAAWGILQGKTWILLLITAALMVICIGLLFKLGKNSKIMFWSLNLILFGGIGNMIDRIFRNGNVVDFLHFEFYPEFPIFNVADCAVVVGGGLLILYFVLDMLKEYRQEREEET